MFELDGQISGEDCSSTGRLSKELRDEVICVDHIAIAVRNLAEAIDWYANKLGFRLIEERTTRGRQTAMVSAVLMAGSTVVVLVQGTEPQSQVSRFVDAFGAGVQHLAFSVKDLDRAVRRVEATGGALDTPVIGGQGIRQAFLRRDAGSGVRIELIERRGGTFSDQSVERLFRAFEEDDLY